MWAADISRVVIWRQMGASVLLSKESPITKTLHLLLAALVVIRVLGWTFLVPSPLSSSKPLSLASPFSHTRAWNLLARGTSGLAWGFSFCPEQRQGSNTSHPAHVDPLSGQETTCHLALSGPQDRAVCPPAPPCDTRHRLPSQTADCVWACLATPSLSLGSSSSSWAHLWAWHASPTPPKSSWAWAHAFGKPTAPKHSCVACGRHEAAGVTCAIQAGLGAPSRKFVSALLSL